MWCAFAFLCASRAVRPSRACMDPVIQTQQPASTPLSQISSWLATASWAPVAGNYGFYSSKVLDDSFTKALLTTDRAEKTKLYNAGQDAIWNDAPWIFLINEQNVSAKVKNLKKFYVQPDAGFDYYEAELD